MQIVVLISGRGSNLEAIINKAKNYSLLAVLADKEATGLSHAKRAGISALALPKRKDESRSQHKSRIFAEVQKLEPDVIVLAGFMQILPAHFVQQYSNKIINIHPSLLPAYPGLHTHERALKEGAQTHGCSVHLVDDGVDTGDVIASAAVPVVPGESVESLSERVLAREHEIYPWVLNALGKNQLELQDRQCSDAIRQEAEEHGFQIGTVFLENARFLEKAR